MGAGRGRSLCALWGGISLGVGTLAFALFSSSSAGCSTNLVVLTHGAVTARGCAAFSAVSRVGVGLVVVGAVLLLGSFVLAVRTRRQAPGQVPGLPAEVPTEPERAAVPVVTVPPVVVPAGPEPDAVEPDAVDFPVMARSHEPEAAPETVSARTRPIAPGEDVDESAGRDDVELPGSVVRLPPGWYGNPDNPGRPVQWWDGTKLTDRPG